MDGIANGLSDKEQDEINARDLESVGDTNPGLTTLNASNGINGADAGGQL
ncbi:hypothetical protein AGMMS50225_26460 [Betaproteobacteria bacterium]|nr:hypothetical protein AGMMS50225_26460 [Betaproteobacteria bacterium]